MSTNIEPTCEADCTFARVDGFRVSGGELSPLTLRYALYGALNERRDNAVLVCHALSGSARVADSWAELFGPRRPFHPSRHRITRANVCGACPGPTGPRSTDARTGQPYGGDFPLVTISDMVRAQSLLLHRLGVERLRAVVGGSIGGMQALQWAVDFPKRVERCVAIGAAPLPALGLALNH